VLAGASAALGFLPRLDTVPTRKEKAWHPSGCQAFSVAQSAVPSHGPETVNTGAVVVVAFNEKS
jgi:hypothetical protein